MSESLPAVGALMRKLDAQSGVLDTFADMLAAGEVEHEKATVTARSALSAQNDALASFEVLSHLREAVKDQLHVLKSGHYPTLPLP